MRLHAANDDRAAAMHVYHACVTTLRRELNVEPSPLTCEMYKRLLHLDARPRPPVQLQASVSPLVGRDHEWSLLQQAWREASSRPRLVLITGETGIGKTRLAEELIEWAIGKAIPLTAHCYSAESLALAHRQWLRAHPRRLDDGSEVAQFAKSSSSAELASSAAHEASACIIQRLLRTRTGSFSCFCSLNLQWCDRDTLRCFYRCRRH
jgi:hypothetical protein